MKADSYNPSCLLPYDLLLVPVAVLLCFYLVVFQLEQPTIGILDKVQEKNLVSLHFQEVNDTQSLMMRKSMTPSYPRVASFSLNLASIQGASTMGGSSYSVNRSNSAVHHFPQEVNSTETNQTLSYNSIKQVTENPVSTFSTDVDTGGFANIRRLLSAGQMPNEDQIRTEEIINYFSYDYPRPASMDKPFSITTEMTPSPWNKDSHLLQIGLRGFEQDVSQLPNSNIVFLVDVSGSMADFNKLPLVKRSLNLITKNLRTEDRVSIVVYAGRTQVLLSSTPGSDKNKIYSVISTLGAGGSTAGESGLKLAYQEAEKGRIKNGNNRIILMTDGDFNVGLSGVDEMVRLVKSKRKIGIFLSTVGFGQGNYREDMMEQIADHGDGVYFYIDSYQEAIRVFERNLRSNLFAIAKDVKIQIEFNPNQVSEYRLVGYENRMLNREDFNNDKVDAGDIGQGHTVTAIYEITLNGKTTKVDPSRYLSKNREEQQNNQKYKDEIAFVKLRYKPVNSHASRRLTKKIMFDKNTDMSISVDFKKAISAASFAELLRNSRYIKSSFSYSTLLTMIDRINKNSSEELFELKELVLLAKFLTKESEPILPDGIPK